MSGRTIRPRPISFTERIPVFFLNRGKNAEENDADAPALDPALVQFLRNCEREREENVRGGQTLLSGLETSRARKKRRTLGPDQQPVTATPGHGSKACTVKEQPADGEQATAIHVPSCREVADYNDNEDAMARANVRKAADAGPSVPLVSLLPGNPAGLSALGNLLGLDADPYIIYQDVLRDRRVEPALLQYNMDEQDEKALAGINAQQRATASAAGRANGATATRATAAAAAAAAAAVLDEGGFEALMGALEQAHFAALQQQKDLWQAEVKAGKVPKLPPADKILPWDAAVEAMKQHQPPLPPLPRALYNHWLKRRKQEGGPLLGYLWYEQPWKAICFQDRTPGNEGQQGDMPFMAAETKNSSRGGWNRLRISKRAAYQRLLETRNELELLRTMADQVRKRERLKKHLLKLYRAEMAAKLGLPLHAKHQHANPHPAAAGGTGPSVLLAAGAAANPPAAPVAQGATNTARAAASAGLPGEPPTKRRRLATNAGPGLKGRRGSHKQAAVASTVVSSGLEDGKRSDPAPEPSVSSSESSDSDSDFEPASPVKRVGKRATKPPLQRGQGRGRGGRVQAASESDGEQESGGRGGDPSSSEESSADAQSDPDDSDDGAASSSSAEDDGGSGSEQLHAEDELEAARQATVGRTRGVGRGRGGRGRGRGAWAASRGRGAGRAAVVGRADLSSEDPGPGAAATASGPGRGRGRGAGGVHGRRGRGAAGPGRGSALQRVGRVAVQRAITRKQKGTAAAALEGQADARNKGGNAVDVAGADDLQRHPGAPQSPCSSPSRRSSPTRGTEPGDSNRPSSSSPEPSRSPSHSPPQRRGPRDSGAGRSRGVNGDGKANGGKANGDVEKLTQQQQRPNERGKQQQRPAAKPSALQRRKMHVRFARPAVLDRSGANRTGGVTVRGMRELNGLLRESGTALLAPRDGAAATTAMPAAAPENGEGGMRKVTSAGGDVGCSAAGDGRQDSAQHRKQASIPAIGNRPPQDASNAEPQASASLAGSAQTHRKKRAGWLKELASLQGKAVSMLWPMRHRRVSGAAVSELEESEGDGAGAGGRRRQSSVASVKEHEATGLQTDRGNAPAKASRKPSLLQERNGGATRLAAAVKVGKNGG